MKQLLLLLFGGMQLMTPALAQKKPSNSMKSAQGSDSRVKTVNGWLEGTHEKSGVYSFKGIPFAAPPIGELRWQAPQPVKNWQGTRAAKRFGPRAMQPPIFGDMNFRSNGMSEDCLYLNVWSPNTKGKLPVLVYFYGGGFVAGDGSEPRYDGESMAQKGVVALTVNYRLGVFGFLAHPELTRESSYHGSGNYALMDQAAALQWVKQNIGAFGGDPDKITIAGESAGSVSVSAQMASPLSRHLVAGAIGESGSLLGTLPPVPLSQAEQNGVQFAQSIGAASLAQLRALNADSLLRASTKYGPFRFSMTIDGYFFPKDPLAIYQAGEQARVPLLVGWNSEEMNYHAIMGEAPLTRENFEKAVQKLYGDRAADVLQAYTARTDADVEQVATDLATDRFIAFSTWRWSDLQARSSGKPVYRYYYSRPRPPMRPEMGNATPGLAGGVQRGAGKAPQAPPKGAVHSAEIEYAMGNLSTNKVYAWTPEDYKVSRIMQQYFANFIKTGNPNGSGLPQWPSVNSSQPAPVLHIDVNTRVVPDTHERHHQLLEQMAPKAVAQ